MALVLYPEPFLACATPTPSSMRMRMGGRLLQGACVELIYGTARVHNVITFSDNVIMHDGYICRRDV